MTTVDSKARAISSLQAFLSFGSRESLKDACRLLKRIKVGGIVGDIRPEFPDDVLRARVQAILPVVQRI